MIDMGKAMVTVSIVSTVETKSPFKYCHMGDRFPVRGTAKFY